MKMVRKWPQTLVSPEKLEVELLHAITIVQFIVHLPKRGKWNIYVNEKIKYLFQNAIFVLGVLVDILADL